MTFTRTARGCSASRQVNVGDLVMVERGRNKAICQVMWAGDPASALRGQFTVQCVDGRTPWDEELRQMRRRPVPAQSISIAHGRRRLVARGFGAPEPTVADVRGFMSKARRK